jgi:ATP-dependent DNA helicase RecG
MSKVKIAKETRQRLELMTATTDGFQIAEADLKMRGPGDIEGTMQSGIAFDLHIANLATDGSIIQLARNAADSILDHDPELTSPALQPAARLIAAIYNRTIDFSRIS